MAAAVPEVEEGFQARAASRARAQGKRAAAAYGSQAAYVGSRARVTPGDRGYQPVILAEFLAAVVIVIAIPVVSGGSPTAQAKGSPSPYDTGDLRQLAAIGMVYFVLALISSGNSGRLAAWFGGLVLIVLALGKTASGSLSATVKNLPPPEAKGTGAGTAQ